MKIAAAAADPGVHQAITGSVAAGSAVAWVTTATEVAMAIVGVPLQVVLAAATGAFGARAMMPATTYRKAVSAGICWSLIGIFCAQGLLAILSKVVGVDMPVGGLSMVALATAGGGQWAATPENIAKFRSMVGRVLDGIGKGADK